MTATGKLSPARPISDSIPAAVVPSVSNPAGWSFRSYTGLATGIVVKQIVGADGSVPTIIWIGFNKQRPAPFQVLDSFEYKHGFSSIEFYNNSNTVWRIQATIYDGDLRP